MNKRLRVLMVLGVALAHAEAALASNRVIRADLSFHFVCKEKDRATLEESIDGFLWQRGFKVLNQGRIQREHGFFLSKLNMIGLDDERRLINVVDVPSGQGRYSIVLNTPPPTKRTPQLEEALLGFTSNGLGCDVQQVIRGENAANAAEFYSDMIRRIEGFFRQAEQLRGEWRL